MKKTSHEDRATVSQNAEVALSRREALAVGASLPLALALGRGAQARSYSDHQKTPIGPPTQTQPAAILTITEQSMSPLGRPTPATVANAMLPGPELRFQEGEHFKVWVQNAMKVPTTLHWHGMILPNYMDGVPGLTQYPIPAGESVYYEYPLLQSGTYWYHSHYGFQEQTGLYGPLIIESKREPYAYDHEAVVVLGDWLDQSPENLISQFRGQMPMTPAGEPPKSSPYPFPGDKPFKIDVNYPGYLMNGRSNDSPWTFEARKGDRIRFRLINGSTSSFFRVALADHELELIAADGQPIEPIRGDNLVIGTAERYDFLVTLKRSGSFTLHAAALGTQRQVVGAVHTSDVKGRAAASAPNWGPRTVGASRYSQIRSPYPTTLPEGPIRNLKIELGGDMKNYLWSMNGEYYPEAFSPEGKAEPLWIRAGERVRMRIVNKTMMYHPMHLHGHFFRLLPKLGAWDDPQAPLKDTLAIGPGQQLDCEFFADNPGNWFFHCHNLYHLASGMAREVRYRV